MTNFFQHISFIKTAVCIGCFFVLGCENNMQEVQQLGKKKISVEEAVDVTSYLSQNAIMKAKLTAPRMLRTNSDTVVTEFPNSLQVEFYNDSTKPESHLFAKYGRYLQYQSRVYLRDSVIVYNYTTKDTLRTDELYWDQNDGRFYTDKDVQIRTPTEKLNGSGLVADQAFSWWTLKNASGPMLIADSTLPAQ
jgi:LPS export ABC transporter protein LptC